MNFPIALVSNHFKKTNPMKRLLLIAFCALFFHPNLRSQVLENSVNLGNIATVRLFLNGAVTSYPILQLGGGSGLTLTFDDLDNEVRNFNYSLIHCNADWKPSNLQDQEYIEGFKEDRVSNYRFSTNTDVKFVHYSLNLPNDNMQWTKSGNYVLKVFENNQSTEPILLRRFVVVENAMQVIPKIVLTNSVEKSSTHQEIDFTVKQGDLKASNPQVEIFATVLQNGRWDNALMRLSPVFTRGDDVIFDYQDKIVFPGMKEFRYVDLRSLRYKTDRVQDLEEREDGYYVRLRPDKVRAYSAYIYNADANGNYVIANVHDVSNGDLSADYAEVTFSLARNASFDDGDVYIFGALTDWETRDDNKMKYNEKTKAYEVTMLLKQGYYNYTYAFVKKGNIDLDFQEIEGNSYETENDYTILVYYRPFGSRYDRVVAAQTVNTLRR
jgi:Domain of unknown function (DUF5103)